MDFNGEFFPMQGGGRNLRCIFRRLHPVFQTLARLAPVVAVAFCVVWCPGCAAPARPVHQVSSAPVRRMPAALKVSGGTPGEPAAGSQKSRQELPAATSKPPAPVTQTRATPASNVRAYLPKDCVVLESGSTSLLIKRAGATNAPSLFEEAIALGKLRGMLASKAFLPKETPRKTKLQNGTATIPFGKSVPPENVADVMVAALSIESVQKVRALWLPD